MQKIFYTFILMCLCFVSSAQKHAVIKLKDCEVVIYNAYENSKDEEEGILKRKIVNDTAKITLVGVFGQEIQGKVIAIKTNIADSFKVEQRCVVDIVYNFECCSKINIPNYRHFTEWKELKAYKVNQFKIKVYSKNEQSLTPYKVAKLKLKDTKKLLKESMKREYPTMKKSDLKSYFSYIDKETNINELVYPHLSSVELLVSLYKDSKLVGQKVLLFYYVLHSDD
jgi:hypothetical protein